MLESLSMSRGYQFWINFELSFMLLWFCLFSIMIVLHCVCFESGFFCIVFDLNYVFVYCFSVVYLFCKSFICMGRQPTNDLLLSIYLSLNVYLDLFIYFKMFYVLFAFIIYLFHFDLTRMIFHKWFPWNGLIMEFIYYCSKCWYQLKIQ